MKIAIYQVNLERDSDGVAFESLDRLEETQGTSAIYAEIYDKVYEGEMDGTSLEDVYTKFNIDRPEDFKGRSLSVSDIVEVKESDAVEPGCYYCDSIGFEKVDFDVRHVKEGKTEDKISVLIVEPEKQPYMKEIGMDLGALQTVVDGDIETYYPFADDVVVVCNEEGKINGMPLNRAIRDENGELTDIIAGTFFIAGLGEDNFASLNPEMEKKYAEMFKTPELFISVNNQIHVIPIENSRVKQTVDKGDR